MGLRKYDKSGLLVSVSRSISSAADKAVAARDLRDQINAIRKDLDQREVKQPSIAVDIEKQGFIRFALGENVLQFGSFRLKSGRNSPYFFNAGLFNSGESITKLSKYYAKAIRKSGNLSILLI